MVDEANAIGTVFLRTDMLPPPLRDEARAAIDKYLDARVEESALPLHDEAARAKVNGVAIAGHSGLWHIAVRAALQENTSRAPTLMFVDFRQPADRRLWQADLRLESARSRARPRAAARHVPAGRRHHGVLGRQASHRPSPVTFILIGLMVVLVFIVLDLDRPRRGIINVDHSSLQDLQASVKAGLKSDRKPPPEAGGK